MATKGVDAVYHVGMLIGLIEFECEPRGWRVGQLRQQYTCLARKGCGKLTPSSEKPHNGPYFWPFHNSIMSACFELWDLGWRERFEIIFDEQVIFGPRAKAWYPVVRDVVKLREPDAYSIMPADPTFGTDDEFLPLQAADLFAWCWRRGMTTPQDRPFEWLLEELRNVQLSKHSQFYDQKRMESVSIDALNQAVAIRCGLQPEMKAIAEKYREYFGKQP